MNAEQQVAAIRAALDGPEGFRQRARGNTVGAGRVVRAIDDILGAGPKVRPCPCECNNGGFCGGCGHAGCSGGINVR